MGEKNAGGVFKSFGPTVNGSQQYPFYFILPFSFLFLINKQLNHFYLYIVECREDESMCVFIKLCYGDQQQYIKYNNNNNLNYLLLLYYYY
jgi:hypothetical protein